MNKSRLTLMDDFFIRIFLLHMCFKSQQVDFRAKLESITVMVAESVVSPENFGIAQQDRNIIQSKCYSHCTVPSSCKIKSRMGVKSPFS